MKILFYQRTDVIGGTGGTEKVLCNLSSEFVEKGYEIIFMTNENKIGQPFFNLSNDIKFLNIGGTNFVGIRKFIFKLIKSTFLLETFKYFNNYKYTSDIIYKKINEIKPDLIILANPSDLLEFSYSNIYKQPIIQMIHNVPWHIFHRKSKRVLTETLRVMKNANVCQVLMPSFVNLIKPFYSGKVVVIPNYVPSFSDEFNCSYTNNKEKCIIINIARINRIKNQKLIIESFAKIANKYKNWEINLWGSFDKKYKKELDLLIKNKNLENKVIFKGNTSEPLMELKNADIFAFPSLFEGFGLALTEAMAVGLPCIGLKSATAINELIVNEENGLLSENNIEDFVKKLEKLINNEELRKKLGASAKNSMKSYNKERILSLWEELIKENI